MPTFEFQTAATAREGNSVPVIGVVQLSTLNGAVVDGNSAVLTVSSPANAGTVAAGARSIAVAVTGSSNVTFAGGTLPPGASLSVSAPPGYAFGATAYNATNSAITLAVVTVA